MRTDHRGAPITGATVTALEAFEGAARHGAACAAWILDAYDRRIR